MIYGNDDLVQYRYRMYVYVTYVLCVSEDVLNSKGTSNVFARLVCRSVACREWLQYGNDTRRTRYAGMG